MTKYSFISLIIILIGFNLNAQQTKLSGIVVDSKTKLPINSANITITNQSFGTTTDLEGVFNLSLNLNDFINDSLIISFLGYVERQIAIKDFKNNSVIILEPLILELDESISVTAEKFNVIKQEIPHSKIEINAEEIERIGSGEISDLFKAMPSVRIEGNDLDGRTIQIRGSNSDEVNVFLDGILLNSLRYDNVADLTLIPTENIEKLEVLKGGNMMLVGNGAFGGVINIVTKKSFQNKYFVKYKGGSQNSKYFLANVDVPINNKILLNYFGQYNTMEPEIEYYSGEQYADKTINKNIKTTKQNHHLNFNYFTDKGNWNGKLIGYFYNYEKPYWSNNHRNFITSANYNGSILNINDLELNINSLYSEDDINRNPPGNAEYISEYKTNRLNARIAKKFAFAETEFQFLTEYFHDELKNSSKSKVSDVKKNIYYSNVYDNRVSGAGVFTFKDKINDNQDANWNTYLGLRGDFMANGNNEFTYTFGTQIDWKKEKYTINPYVNYGKNVKYPTLLENAFILDIADFYHNDSTSNRLKPEYATSGELGINFSYFPLVSYLGSIDISLSFFTNNYYNKLLKRPFDNFISDAQDGDNFTKGFEASIAFNQILKQFSFQAFYTGINISSPFLYAYKPNKNFIFQLDWFYRDLYIKATHFYEGKSTAWFYDIHDQLQIETISPFYDIDISAGYKLKFNDLQINLQLSGYNILDNSGYKYYTLKKRFLQFSVSLQY